MNENEIKEALIVYMKEHETDYAIMLNGKWGIGKTFFAKNVLMKFIQDTYNKPVIYNSLFGINTIEEFWESLALQIYDIKANEKSRYAYFKHTKKNIPMQVLDNHKGAGLTSHIFKGLLDIIPKGNSLNNILSTLLQSSLDFSQYVYIIDDFERLGNNIDIKNMIGAIDLLANQSGAKVVVLCNESFFFTEKISEQVTEGEKQKADTIVTIKEEYKDYKEFKEKFVGVTLNYIPNINNVLNYFIEECDEDTKAFLNSNIDTVKECLDVSGCCNIRTIRFTIKRFAELRQRLVTIYSNITKDMKYSDLFFSRLLESCFYTSISYKEHSKLLTYEKNILVQLAQFSNDGASRDFRYWSMVNTYVSYKPLDFYIKSYNFNEEEFVKIIWQHIIDESNKYAEFIAPFKDMFIASEEKVLECVITYLKMLEDDVIPINAYPKIMEPIFELCNALGKEEYKSQCESLMLANIEKTGAKFSREHWFGSAGFLHHSNEAYWRLYKRIEALSASDKWEDMNRIINGDDEFILRFKEIMDSLEPEMYGTNKGFMANIDYKALANKVAGVNTSDISEFRAVFRKIYPDNLINIKECRGADKDALIGFLYELKEQVKINPKDKIWMYHFKCLCNYISSIIEKL